MSLPSILIMFLGSFFAFMLVFILGILLIKDRLRVKTKYIAIVVGTLIFFIFLWAGYVNYSAISVFSLVLSGLIAIFAAALAFFMIELAKWITKQILRK